MRIYLIPLGEATIHTNPNIHIKENGFAFLELSYLEYICVCFGTRPVQFIFIVVVCIDVETLHKHFFCQLRLASLSPSAESLHFASSYVLCCLSLLISYCQQTLCEQVHLLGLTKALCYSFPSFFLRPHSK